MKMDDDWGYLHDLEASISENDGTIMRISTILVVLYQFMATLIGEDAGKMIGIYTINHSLVNLVIHHSQLLMYRRCPFCHGGSPKNYPSHG